MIDKIKDLIITYEIDHDDFFVDNDISYEVGTDEYLVKTKDGIYYGHFYTWHDDGMPYDWTLAIGGTIKDHLLKNPDKPLLFMDYEIDTLGPYTCEISDVIDIAKVEDAFK